MYPIEKLSRTSLFQARLEKISTLQLRIAVQWIILPLFFAKTRLKNGAFAIDRKRHLVLTDFVGICC